MFVVNGHGSGADSHVGLGDNDNYRYIIFLDKTIWRVRVTRTIYPLGSQFKLPRSASSLEQMRLLADEAVTQTRAVRSSAWIRRWTQMTVIQTNLNPNRRNTVQRESQKAFQFTHRHLPCIYCSDIHCTTVLWQKSGIFTLNFITGIIVYNYSMYLWLHYSMCPFILNVFHTNRLPKLKVYIYIYIYIYICMICMICMYVYHGIEVLYVWI